MQIKVLSTDFKITAIIDSANSLKYTESFREAGEFYLRVPFSSELYKKLFPPARVLVEDLIFNIEKIELENGEIIVEGIGLFDEFSQMYITTPRTITATPFSIVSMLASEANFEGANYVYYGLTSGSSQAISIYEWCSTYSSILLRIFKDYNLGYRLKYDDKNGEIAFHLRELIDKAYNEETRVVLNDQREEYELVRCLYDIKNYKNYVHTVQMYQSSGELYSQTYDRTNGEPKREIAVATTIPADTEGALFSGFNTVANKVFERYTQKELYEIRILKDRGIKVGDICAFENEKLGFGKGATVLSRKVRYNGASKEEILVLEIEK